MLLLSDPAIAALDVIDNGEPLLDLRARGDFALDTRKSDPDGQWARLRRGVVERLQEAEKTLPEGVRLLIVEGYRPAELQERYFTSHCDDLREAHPDWSDERLATEASKHVSPVSVAPHPCGAAVDLTLTLHGVELDLGTPVNATPDESDNACFTGATNISADARRWRDTLSASLAGAGLVNYAPEWWHWSYGDRYWAAVTGASEAIYAPQ